MSEWDAWVDDMGGIKGAKQFLFFKIRAMLLTILQALEQEISTTGARQIQCFFQLFLRSSYPLLMLNHSLICWTTLCYIR